jgi:Methane oxygenase PmoA
MQIDRRTFLTVASTAISTAVGTQPRAYTLERDAAGRTLKDPAGRTVLTYLTSKPADVPLASNSACCVHPFNTLSGERVTDIAPDDHRTHRGIFFAWHDMEFTRGDQVLKGDFWGWGKFAPLDGRIIVNRDIGLARADDRHAEIGVRNDWMIADRPVLEEATVIRASEEAGTRVLDFTFRFTSSFDVTINQTAFTGFCFRCRKDGKAAYGDSNGEVTLPNSRATEPDTDWPARDWYSYTIALNSGKTVTAAVFDHPANPPSKWHGARGVSFLNPCIAANGRVKIPANQALQLRYRAAVIDGMFREGLLDAMAKRWKSL